MSAGGLVPLRLPDDVTVTTVDGVRIVLGRVAVTEGGRARAGEPPEMPGLLLARVQASLTDDAGTAYLLQEGEVAGDEKPWHARWRYTPRPPSGARLLHLAFAVDGHHVAACSVALR